MVNQKKFIVSHAPFWHDGGSITARSYHTLLATIPAVLAGIAFYGTPALAVIAFSVSTAVFWELVMNYAMKRPITIGDGNAAVIGMIFGMLIPATSPWWFVLTGTCVAIVIGKQIFGGMGANPFNPVLIGLAILTLSWPDYLDFNMALKNYEVNFTAMYPLTALKNFGPQSIDSIPFIDLLIGKQMGGIGTTFGLGIILGGIYLIIRGYIRWEITLSFLVGVFISALLFKAFGADGKYAGPMFHLFTGYTLIGAFFLATEDSSSPVNFIPMLIYGAGGGFLTVLIRNIGVYADGVVFAILLMNLINPILDKIRPKAIGKVF